MTTADDLVVGLAAGERRRQLADDRLGLEKQPPGRLFSAVRRRSAMPSSISWSRVTQSSSRNRLAWRALRATSDIPFLLLSSSSSVTIGR